MNNLERIKHLRAQDYGVAGLSTTDVDWLIAEVERLTAERDRLQRWQDEVMVQEIVGYAYVPDSRGKILFDGDSISSLRRSDLIVRPQPLKENE